jgi:KaiC/GvpD/RAD55 family RecA-like ATPase
MAITRRVKSGIPGLDALLEGGFLEKSVNMITGETGTGKTLFASQFIWNGLLKGESGVYITLEESPEDIRADAMNFGWDLAKYEKKGLFRIIYHDPAQVNNLGSLIIGELGNMEAKRIVIDSTSILGLNIESPTLLRRKLFNIVTTIKKTEGCTTLITSEIPEGSKALSRFGVEEYVVDGVIVLNYLGSLGENTSRSLLIRKMRRTNHGKDIYPMHISKSGITIKKAEI